MDSEDHKIYGEIIIAPLIKAKKSFEIALNSPVTDLNRDATIQRFEYTFELAWKTMKRVLKYKGVLVNNPRDVIREAALQGLIEDPKQWFTYLNDRNQTTHIYNENVAEDIYQNLPKFQKSLTALLEKLFSL